MKSHVTLNQLLRMIMVIAVITCSLLSPPLVFSQTCTNCYGGHGGYSHYQGSCGPMPADCEYVYAQCYCDSGYILFTWQEACSWETGSGYQFCYSSGGSCS